MEWKVKKKREIYRNKWLWITEDDVQTDFGEDLVYSVIHQHPFVIIIPWDGERLTLVGQYRYCVDSFSWEFPMGHGEGRDHLVAAKAELREEVGYEAENLDKIGDYFLGPGHIDQIGHIFLATGLSDVGTNHEPGEQGMKAKKVTISEFEDMIKNGEIKDGPTLSAYTLLKLNKLWIGR